MGRMLCRKRLECMRKTALLVHQCLIRFYDRFRGRELKVGRLDRTRMALRKVSHLYGARKHPVELEMMPCTHNATIHVALVLQKETGKAY